MKISKPKFWSKKNTFISFLLLPLAFLYQILILINKSITRSKKFNIPIVCIGNIYLGGTGKTPLALLIMELLTKKGKKPSIIKKFYQEHFDEHEMIKNHTKQLFLNKDRSLRSFLHMESKNFFQTVIITRIQ